MANASNQILEKAALLREIQQPSDLSQMSPLSKRLERKLYWDLAERASRITHSRLEWRAAEEDLRRAIADARISRLVNKRYKWMSDERGEPGVVDHEYTEVELARIWEAEARVDYMRLRRARMSAEYEGARSRLWPAFREEHVKRLETQAENLQALRDGHGGRE